jgi:hypothetical protein
MLANIRLLRKELREVIVVPRDAVLDEAEGKAVFVDASGKAVRRSVEVGSVRGRFTVARSGLSVGDRLIVLGHRQVVDGQNIEVRQAEPCCAAQVEELLAKQRAAEEAAAAASNKKNGERKGKASKRSPRVKRGPKTAGNAG